MTLMIEEDFRRRRNRADAQTSPRRAHDLLRAGIRVGVVREQLIEDVLSSALWSSRNAVRSALHMLVNEGLVSRQPRHGTTVIRRVASVPLEELMPPPTGAPGEALVRVEQLEVRSVPVNGVVADRLMITSEHIALSEQLVFIDDEAVCLRTSYLVTDLPLEETRARLDEIDAQHIPSADAFRAFFGVDVLEVESTIEAIPGERDACQILGIAVGSPVLLRESVHRDVDGQPRLLVYAHYRGDRIALATLVKVERDGA